MADAGWNEWGPQTCQRDGCGGALPPGLVFLGKDRHVDCEEARKAWEALREAGRAPAIRR